MEYRLHTGDSLAELALYPDNYFDSVVTDPPYGLGREPDALEMLSDWITTGRHEVKSRGGFMGKKWDAFVPQPILWREVYRVLKPGAHLLAFAGTRTHDLVTLALRLAGFEIRDTVYWLYGSGFPKSRDISKAIDEEAGAERIEIVGDYQYAGRRKNTKIGRGETVSLSGGDSQIPPDYITAPATPAAREWSGWGTALKPSAEPITLARKPISESTIAANVLRWHTGAINVDGCRVAGVMDGVWGSNQAGSAPGAGGTMGGNWQNETYRTQPSTLGRWPANVIHDGSDEVEAGFPETTSGAGNGGAKVGVPSNGIPLRRGTLIPRFDTGSASRFFYCAKASRKDRDEGLEEFEEIMSRRYGEQGQGPLAQQTPRKDTPQKNNHPTVKPVSLMRYLCRLITPPGGVILDPFAGSGSTGKAAAWEGFDFVGIDLDAGYIDMARARIEHAIREAERERVANQPALLLAA